VRSGQVAPDQSPLREWDWRADLRAQERTIPWLARKTDRAQSTVYAYAYGTVRPSLSWLEEAARVLGKAVPA
jgi:hypothetical protein